ncbi:hypothetical protein RhiirA4_426689 [Rhizophagus irregularis]|uniref:Uncharacterized protein n=1 Tax=Rhizophagus irregularis TaxID=588596 RepID=A0A2I1H622_9GLOM|nr:hypothetical protein RhiirA4_426689 [Rhizophagus irregularis]
MTKFARDAKYTRNKASHKCALNAEMNKFIQKFPNACQKLKIHYTFDYDNSSTKEVKSRLNKHNVNTNYNLDFSHSVTNQKHLRPPPEPLLDSLEAGMVIGPTGPTRSWSPGLARAGVKSSGATKKFSDSLSGSAVFAIAFTEALKFQTIFVKIILTTPF